MSNFLIEAMGGKLPEWISAIGAFASMVGVWFIREQLKATEKIAQLQFEDGLAKEYRELASRIPTKALLGADLSRVEYQAAFDEFYRYFDLSNEQIFLRKSERVSKDAWQEWCAGIKYNLELPAFNRAWENIKDRCESFQELRRLESEHFEVDPYTWKSSLNT